MELRQFACNTSIKFYQNNNKHGMKLSTHTHIYSDVVSSQRKYQKKLHSSESSNKNDAKLERHVI